MARSEFSDKTKMEAFVRSKGKCEVPGCNRKIFSGAEYDHATPCAVGGTNDISNCIVTCPSCHSRKTNTKDKPEIAKTVRIIKKRAGIKPRKGPPLPGTKASGLRKRMSGQVERW